MFQAGFARVDVTPPLGNPLAGYSKERYADGVLDPIELNALAVRAEEDTVLLITGDFIYIMESAATPIRALVSEKTGVPADHILLHGLHQHTSIRLGNREGRAMAHTVKDTAYLDLVYRKFCDVANLAIADLSDATLHVAEKETKEPISFIRRYKMRDGSFVTNPGFLNPDVVAPVGEADNTVRLARFHREGKKDIALVNFQTHPDVIGGNKYSADWPGFARRIIEKDLSDVRCLLINGPQGDTNHYNVFKEAITGPENRYNHSRFMGRAIADVVVDIWDKTREKKSDAVFGEVRMVFVPTNMKGLDRMAEMERRKKDLEEGKIGNLSKNEKLEMNRILDLKNETIFRKLPVTVIGMGDLVLAGFGGEAFTRYGKSVREAAPDFYVMALCCANGGQGYLPDQSAYAEGGYGVDNSRFSPEVAPMTQDAAKEMMNTYRTKRG